MATPDNKNTNIASAVDYVVPSFSQEILQNAKHKEDIERHILEQTQGEAVALGESFDIPTLMYITNIIYRSSPELVFVTKDGLKIQIFDFSYSPVIRPDDIITFPVQLPTNISAKKVSIPLTINIQKIWEEEKTVNFEQRLALSLQEIVTHIKETPKATLLGTTPAVLFLLTQHFLASHTKELWYQSDLRAKPLRIY